LIISTINLHINASLRILSEPFGHLMYKVRFKSEIRFNAVFGDVNEIMQNHPKEWLFSIKNWDIFLIGGRKNEELNFVFYRLTAE
jgi:hypothetical protein